jgi:hypothetical protein
MNCPDRESVTEQFIVQFQGKTTFGVDRVQYVLHEAELRNIRKHGRENTGEDSVWLPPGRPRSVYYHRHTPKK